MTKQVNQNEKYRDDRASTKLRIDKVGTLKQTYVAGRVGTLGLKVQNCVYDQIDLYSRFLKCMTVYRADLCVRIKNV